MYKKIWNFKINENNHVLELKHGNVLGTKLIFLDGTKLPESRLLFNYEEDTSFSIDEHKCVLRVNNTGIDNKCTLWVDNNTIEDSNKVKAKYPMPYWCWLFIIACGIIPVASVEGVVSLCTGIFGIYKCTSTCTNNPYPQKKKAIICATVTLLCWVFIRLYMFAVKYLTIYLNGKLY